MRCPISGIVTGFRMHKGDKNSSDYGELDILQVGTKDYKSHLEHIYVQDLDLIEQLLTDYSSGSLRWINTFCQRIPNGRETVFLLQKIFDMSEDVIPVEDGL
ncbi:hypothetical protein [Paenibacillus sp. SI8]|uniref:hypothetical protein n=1 Tax=unclassified Paenibacillus TaxID=185978 RepID=UPI00346718C3